MKEMRDPVRTGGEWAKLDARAGVAMVAASETGGQGEKDRPEEGGSEKISRLYDVRGQGVCLYACLR